MRILLSSQIFLSAVPYCYIARVPPNVNAMYPTGHQVKNGCPPEPEYINKQNLGRTIESLETTIFQVYVKIMNV
jgi:hypothetical protein